MAAPDYGQLLKDFAELNNSFHTFRESMLYSNDSFFLVSTSIIIFLMACGFAFLEAGSVRSKNTTNILFKNLLDTCISSICYFICGWAFAFGTNGNAFCGFGQFLLIDFDPLLFPSWFFHFAFAATASTIVSGALAERCEFYAYISYCVVLTGFVFPTITHWAWQKDGWLANGPEGIKFKDFAGSGVVHLHGGTTALIGAICLGPRIGRFEDDETGTPAVPMKGHSTPFAALGGFLLMFGFFAFNGGSQSTIDTPGDAQTIGRALTSTMLSGAWAAITVLILNKMFVGKKWSLLMSINGVLVGMVSACSGCDAYEPWACSAVGIGSGLSYLLVLKMVEVLRIDDPLDAAAVHFGGGLWGLMISPIMMNEGIIFVANRRSFLQLGWNCVGALAIIGWSLSLMGSLFLILRLLGLFRVPEEVELKGLDLYKHGEAAYPLVAYGHGWDDPVDQLHNNVKHRGLRRTENDIESRNNSFSHNNGSPYSVYDNRLGYGSSPAPPPRRYFETPEVHAMHQRDQPISAWNDLEKQNTYLGESWT
uniref:Ammonium transporter n=1 Tax=Plectus sambesii TaxID=2011161 RepID=A0A914XGP8_9BILA